MLADDLAQETFIKAFYAWDSFAALSSAQTWLFRIAYNTFYDYLRTHHITEDLDDCLAQEDTSASSDTDNTCSPVAAADLRMDVEQAMRRLSPAERTCVQLFLVEDVPIRQIVKITGMNENTIKSHLRRGKEKLKTFLSDP